MKKLLSLILSAVLALALVPFAAYAQSDLNLNAQNGRLLIGEAGTYTLTGSMRGTVWVDPGQGGVTLILDNITIDGGESAGIAAVSGDSLTVILADGTVNSVQDGGSGGTEEGPHQLVVAGIAPDAVIHPKEPEQEQAAQSVKRNELGKRLHVH